MKLQYVGSLLAILLISCTNKSPVNSNQISDVKFDNIISGDDDSRIQILKSSVLSRKRGYLSVKFKSTQHYQVGGCTATFVGSDILMTSAHCVYDRKEGIASNIEYYPENLDKDESSWSKEFIEGVYIMPEYIQLEKIGDHRTNEYDIALLKVKNLGDERDNTKTNSTGTQVHYHMADKYKYGNYDSNGKLDSSKKAKYNNLINVKLYSYPSDKPEGTMWYQDDCYMAKVNENLYRHNCDTASGSSGATLSASHPRYTPMYNQDYIFGVHSGGNEQLQINYATRINKKRFQTIKDIVDHKSVIRNPELFGYYEIEANEHFTVSIINNCSSTIYVAYRYMDLNEKTNIEGFVELAPGEKIFEAVKTKYNKFDYWAYDKDNKKNIYDGPNEVWVHDELIKMGTKSLFDGIQEYVVKQTCK